MDIFFFLSMYHLSYLRVPQFENRGQGRVERNREWDNRSSDRYRQKDKEKRVSTIHMHCIAVCRKIGKTNDCQGRLYECAEPLSLDWPLWAQLLDFYIRDLGCTWTAHGGFLLFFQKNLNILMASHGIVSWSLPQLPGFLTLGTWSYGWAISGIAQDPKLVF